ncbi:hypothetical protein [Bradyrhizobium sp. HKCCYLR20261]
MAQPKVGSGAAKVAALDQPRAAVAPGHQWQRACLYLVRFQLAGEIRG